MYVCMYVWFRVFADDLIAKFLPSRAKLPFFFDSLVSYSLHPWTFFSIFFFSALAHSMRLTFYTFFIIIYLFLLLPISLYNKCVLTILVGKHLTNLAMPLQCTPTVTPFRLLLVTQCHQRLCGAYKVFMR